MCYVPKNARNLRHWVRGCNWHTCCMYMQVMLQLPFHCIYILFRSKLAAISNSFLKRSLKIVKISIIITEVIHIFNRKKLSIVILQIFWGWDQNLKKQKTSDFLSLSFIQNKILFSNQLRSHCVNCTSYPQTAPFSVSIHNVSKVFIKSQ